MAAREGASQTEPKGRDQAQVHGRGRVVPDNGEHRREDRSKHPDRKLDEQLRSNPRADSQTPSREVSSPRVRE
jgi:hypothetical protein